MQQVHKHWWLWRLQEEQQGGVDDGVSGADGDDVVEMVGVVAKPNIPLEPHRVKGKGRPAGAIATASAATLKIKGHGVNSTKRLPSRFEYELEDELATAVPEAWTGGAGQIAGMKQMKQSEPNSTAPATLCGSKRKQGAVDVDLGQQPKQQKPSMAPETQTRVEDCIWVAGTSTKTAVAVNFEVTSTTPGPQRLEQAGGDLYEPGTAAPRASARIIDGLDVLDPDFEDDHDAALSVANVAASEARQDAANPQ
jgi:hypothetical protein